MTKKLTGRETVIALMQEKTVRRGSGVTEVHYWLPKNGSLPAWTSADILMYDDWELVPESMVQEGVFNVLEICFPVPLSRKTFGIELSDLWKGKRVKVRIEEILE